MSMYIYCKLMSRKWFTFTIFENETNCNTWSPW